MRLNALDAGAALRGFAGMPYTVRPAGASPSPASSSRRASLRAVAHAASNTSAETTGSVMATSTCHSGLMSKLNAGTMGSLMMMPAATDHTTHTNPCVRASSRM